MASDLQSLSMATHYPRYAQIKQNALRAEYIDANISLQSMQLLFKLRFEEGQLFHKGVVYKCSLENCCPISGYIQKSNISVQLH